MSAHPLVSFVVVNWNGRSLLEPCLASLDGLDYPAAAREVLVFDNGSDDGSVAWLDERWPQVRILTSATNLGFAAASNRGAEAAAGEVVAFVNNDVRLAPDWLARMVETLRDEGAAAAGSRVLDWEGRRYDFDGAAMNFYGHGTSLRHGRPAVDDDPGAPRPALFACGAAMVVDRARFLASGGFDPDYFAYFEDVDLGWRLWVQGERVVYEPRAVAFHRHHGSGLDPARRTRLLEQNALASVVKNYDDASLAIVLPAALALLEARARMSGDERRAIYEDTLRAFHAARPALEAKRAAVQARRRRRDEEILPLLVEPHRPSFFGHAYWREQCRVARAGGVDRLFAGTGAMMDDFVEELERRVESLEAELASARAAAGDAAGSPVAALDRPGDERARRAQPRLRRVWRRLRAGWA